MLVEHVSMELDRITRDWEIAPEIYLSSVPSEGQSELDDVFRGLKDYQSTEHYDLEQYLYGDDNEWI